MLTRSFSIDEFLFAEGEPAQKNLPKRKTRREVFKPAYNPVLETGTQSTTHIFRAG
jgi:hypothetical protein